MVCAIFVLWPFLLGLGSLTLQGLCFVVIAFFTFFTLVLGFRVLELGFQELGFWVRVLGLVYFCTLAISLVFWCYGFNY